MDDAFRVHARCAVESPEECRIIVRIQADDALAVEEELYLALPVLVARPPTTRSMTPDLFSFVRLAARLL